MTSRSTAAAAFVGDFVLLDGTQYFLDGDIAVAGLAHDLVVSTGSAGATVAAQTLVHAAAAVRLSCLPLSSPF